MGNGLQMCLRDGCLQTSGGGIPGGAEAWGVLVAASVVYPFVLYKY